MKTKFSKILGVGLTLALLASLLLTTAPVSADVSQPTVSPDDDTISAKTTYAVRFKLGEELPLTAVSKLEHRGTADAEWVTTEKHSGSVSAKLVDGDEAYDEAKVKVAYGHTLSTLTNDGLKYWVKTASGKDLAAIIELDVEGDGVVDVVLHSTNIPTQNNVEWAEDSPTDLWAAKDPDPALVNETYPGMGLWWDGGSWIAETAGAAKYDTLANWINNTGFAKDSGVGGDDVVVNVGAITVGDDTGTFYVDDITIDGTVYALEDDPTFHTITITFNEDTVVPAGELDDATIHAGPGWIAGQWKNATTTNVAFVGDDVELTVTATLGEFDEIGEDATVRIEVPDITNPDDAGDYTLEVSTSVETDLVESAAYAIEVPEIAGLPGVVEVYNPSGILMASYTGDLAMQRAIAKANDEDWVIKLGPGTYGANDTFVADVAGVTFEAADGVTWEGVVSIEAADVVIEGITFDGDGEPVAVTVNSDGIGVSFEDCAFEDADVLLEIDGDGATIDDCTFTIEDDGVGIDVIYKVVTEEEGDETTPPVITDCTFTVEEDSEGTGIEIGADITVEDCTFTVEEDGEGVGIKVTGGVSAIEDSTFDDLLTAFDIKGGEVDIFGGTIQNCAEVAIIVTAVPADGKVLIHNNTITGSDDAVILDVDKDTAAGVVVMLFNDITENAGDDDGLLVNNSADDDLYVINNWWGDADGPSQGEDAFAGAVVYEPFLVASVSDSVIDAATADFDAEDECGVTVTSELVDSGDPPEMAIIGAAKYAENPAGAIDDAIGFWDVCMIGEDVESVTIRFYTDVTKDTEVWVWGKARGEWLEDEGATPNLFSGFIAVDVGAATTPTLDDLAGLPFAVVEPPVEVAELDAPTLNVPVTGADDVSLTPTFAWTPGEDADEDTAYYFQLADNANFVTPMVKLDGDLGRLIVTAYHYATELPYSTPYYWRVKAVSGTIAAGDLAESAWGTGVFITMDEPEEPTPPVEVVEAPPVVIEPIVEVITPAETPITPGWIYAIIAVGGVLVIALLVLIVRTRRVA